MIFFQLWDSFLVDKEKFQRCEKERPKDSILTSRHLHCSQSIQLLTQPHVISNVFPNGYIYIENQWIPLKTTQENLRNATKKANIIVNATKDGDRPTQCTAVSFWNLLRFSRKDSIAMTLEYYGTNDIDVILNHVRLAVDRAFRVCTLNTLAMFFRFPKHVSFDDCEKRLADELGIKPFEREGYQANISALYSFESK